MCTLAYCPGHIPGADIFRPAVGVSSSMTLISPRSVRKDVFVLVAMEGAIIDQSKGGGTMPPIVLTIESAPPPYEVFSYVTDPSRFAEWQEDAARGRREEGGPPGVGSRVTTTRRIGRPERTTTSKISENKPPRSWAAHGIDRPIKPNMHVTFAPLGYD